MRIVDGSGASVPSLIDVAPDTLARGAGVVLAVGSNTAASCAHAKRAIECPGLPGYAADSMVALDAAGVASNVVIASATGLQQVLVLLQAADQDPDLANAIQALESKDGKSLWDLFVKAGVENMTDAAVKYGVTAIPNAVRTLISDLRGTGVSLSNREVNVYLVAMVRTRAEFFSDITDAFVSGGGESLIGTFLPAEVAVLIHAKVITPIGGDKYVNEAGEVVGESELRDLSVAGALSVAFQTYEDWGESMSIQTRLERDGLALGSSIVTDLAAKAVTGELIDGTVLAPESLGASAIAAAVAVPLTMGIGWATQQLFMTNKERQEQKDLAQMEAAYKQQNEQAGRLIDWYVDNDVMSQAQAAGQPVHQTGTYPTGFASDAAVDALSATGYFSLPITSRPVLTHWEDDTLLPNGDVFAKHEWYTVREPGDYSATGPVYAEVTTYYPGATDDH